MQMLLNPEPHFFSSLERRMDPVVLMKSRFVRPTKSGEIKEHEPCGSVIEIKNLFVCIGPVS